jgi:hypothetical protein
MNLSHYFSFPRAGVGTHSRRASVEVKREFSFFIFSFPRAGVGTHSRRASVEVKREFSFFISPFSDDEQNAGASRLHSHASAWERENQILPNLKVWTPNLKVWTPRLIWIMSFKIKYFQT